MTLNGAAVFPLLAHSLRGYLSGPILVAAAVAAAIAVVVLNEAVAYFAERQAIARASVLVQWLACSEVAACLVIYMIWIGSLE